MDLSASSACFMASSDVIETKDLILDSTDFALDIRASVTSTEETLRLDIRSLISWIVRL